MACYIELGFVFPIFIFLFVQFSNYNYNGLADIIVDHLQYPILIIIIIITITTIIIIIIIIIILFTSIKLHFNVQEIRLQPGYFSAPAAISMLAAVLSPPSLFWFVHFIIIITSPMHGMLFNILKCFFRCLLHTLRSIPPLVFRFTFQQQLPPPAPAEVHIHEIIVQQAVPDANNGIADTPM